MKVISVVSILMLAAPAVASAQVAEHNVMKQKRHVNYRHEGCNTHKCDRRMDKKSHMKTLHKWWRATAPFRGWLRSTRMCESGGNYRTNTGNGFYGAYQFVLSTWWSAGGHGYPHLAEPLEQDYRAVVWRKMIGNPHSPGGWPVCG
jgi:hypothetical protein